MVRRVDISVQDRYLIVDSEVRFTIHFNDTKKLDYYTGRYLIDLYSKIGSEGSGDVVLRDVWLEYEDGDKEVHFEWQTSGLSVEELSGVNGQLVQVSNFPEEQKVLVENFPEEQEVSVKNFPVNQGVSVNNFPANQGVSVSNFPAVQNVRVVADYLLATNFTEFLRSVGLVQGYTFIDGRRVVFDGIIRGTWISDTISKSGQFVIEKYSMNEGRVIGGDFIVNDGESRLFDFIVSSNNNPPDFWCMYRILYRNFTL
jgi:hypothetical protein